MAKREVIIMAKLVVEVDDEGREFSDYSAMHNWNVRRAGILIRKEMQNCALELYELRTESANVVGE